MVGHGATTQHGQGSGGNGDGNAAGRGNFVSVTPPGPGAGRGWNLGNSGLQFGDVAQGMNNVHVNPYFLSNSDHPGMNLVATHFNGANFTSWSRSIRIALGAKAKLGFIAGSCVRPSEDSDDHEKWLRADYMVMCWLINSMNSEIVESLMYVQSSKELWDEIKDRYYESNDPLVFQLRRDLSNLKQENLSVGAYFMKLKRIWDELQLLDPIPTCSCGGINQCACNLLKRIVERDEKAKIMQFLLGLNDVYEHLRGNVLSKDPIPGRHKVYQMAVQIERSYSRAS